MAQTCSLFYLFNIYRFTLLSAVLARSGWRLWTIESSKLRPKFAPKVERWSLGVSEFLWIQLGRVVKVMGADRGGVCRSTASLRSSSSSLSQCLELRMLQFHPILLNSSIWKVLLHKMFPKFSSDGRIELIGRINTFGCVDIAKPPQSAAHFMS